MTLTLKAGGNLKTAAGDSREATGMSPALIGDWGAFVEATTAQQ
ncbi:MAG: hypothetical protein ACUZ8O_13895 [Candidatus Anammoxibacter sp.]